MCDPTRPRGHHKRSKTLSTGQQQGDQQPSDTYTKVMEIDSCDMVFPGRRRRCRMDAHRGFYGTDPNQKTLELEGIVKVLQAYDDYGGGINCSICGKLYKSKVCLTKHLWEHSVYWDLFDGDKNHDRVLSIQAALIIYHGFHGNANNKNPLASLLVTAPHHTDKKKERDANNNSPGVTPEKKRPLPPQLKSTQNKSPNKRKRSSLGSSAVPMMSLPGSVSPTYSLYDSEMSPTKSQRQI